MSVPDLIGRYRLLRKLGSGGFAVVWLARDESLETPIAIKIMADHWADRLDLRERFLTEARMLRQAASSRVAQVFDIGELPDGRPYFVMEYADRGTLADRTAVRRLPLVEALRVTAEVARGVAELHLAGIVHRDIKPSNVLIRSTPGGTERYLVADLGVAKSLARASGLTMSVGSAGYMAPEQAQPQVGVDVRADVYSLGALAFHLITGEDPGVPGQVIPRDRLQRELPDPVRRLLNRALEPNRDRRWPDALSFAEQLDALADSYSPPPARPGTAPQSRPRRGRLVALAAVLVIALAAVGFGGTLFWHSQTSWVTVKDAQGVVSIQVPRSWHRDVVNGGWNPQTLGLSGRPAAAVLVATADVTGWDDLNADVDGVFAGLTTDPSLAAKVAAIPHPGCTRGASHTSTGSVWKEQIQHWGHCQHDSSTLAEISLTPTGSHAGTTAVYVQIRQQGGPDRSDQVLKSLRLNV
jgi:hypothetical protein